MLDVLNDPDVSANLKLIKRDSIIETHHFRRVIRVKEGIVLKTKNYERPNFKKTRYEFNVTDISIFWRAGEPVEYIMVYGTCVTDKNLNCRRRYSPEKLPKKIREIIGEDLITPRLVHV